jgi:hypothetical protein
MASTVRTERRPRKLWRTPNGALLGAALVSSAIAWWMIAWPVATLANVASHSGHFALTFAHMIGGSGMLWLGALNLYLAARKDHYPLHRRVGQAYLAFGAFGAVVAMIVTLTPAHKPAGSVILTSSTVSLLTLASAWLCFAALGWRAALNRRFQSHGQWMVRSYVLVWSFVFCRIASRVVPIDGEAFIWLSWVGPLIVCEMVLQWPQGARSARAPTRSPSSDDAARA